MLAAVSNKCVSNSMDDGEYNATPMTTLLDSFKAAGKKKWEWTNRHGVSFR